jgi:hypothetical protein
MNSLDGPGSQRHDAPFRFCGLQIFRYAGAAAAIALVGASLIQPSTAKKPSARLPCRPHCMIADLT